MASKELTVASAQTLAATFDENARLSAPIAGFLKCLIRDNPETFWGLFQDSGRAAEMEEIVHQTIRGMLKAGLPYNPLKLNRDSGCGLVANGEALKNLEDGGFALVSDKGDKITLTDRMLGKLLAYSRDSGRTTSLLVAHSTAKLLP